MNDDLTKVTVNLIPAAMRALETSAEIEGLSRTDVINRALLAYERDLPPAGAWAWVRFRWRRAAR